MALSGIQATSSRALGADTQRPLGQGLLMLVSVLFVVAGVQEAIKWPSLVEEAG